MIDERELVSLIDTGMSDWPDYKRNAPTEMAKAKAAALFLMKYPEATVKALVKAGVLYPEKLEGPRGDDYIGIYSVREPHTHDWEPVDAVPQFDFLRRWNPRVQTRWTCRCGETTTSITDIVRPAL